MLQGTWLDANILQFDLQGGVVQCAKESQAALNQEKVILLGCKVPSHVNLQDLTAGGGFHRL